MVTAETSYSETPTPSDVGPQGPMRLFVMTTSVTWLPDTHGPSGFVMWSPVTVCPEVSVMGPDSAKSEPLGPIEPQQGSPGAPPLPPPPSAPLPPAPLAPTPPCP